MKYLLKDVVEMFGSDSCKKHFEKRNRFTSMDVEAALVKTMKQHYELVEKVKVGRNVYFELDKKKDVASIREDKRIKNGRWSIPYTHELDVLLILWVNSKDFYRSFMGLDTIARFAFIQSLEQSQIITKFLSRKNQEENSREIEELLEPYHCEYNNYVKQDMKEQFSILKRHIKESIERLAKNEFINYRTHMVAKVLHPEQFIELNDSLSDQIKSIKTEVAKENNITIWVGENSLLSPAAIEYRKESHKRIESLILKELKLEDNRRVEYCFRGYELYEGRDDALEYYYLNILNRDPVHFKDFNEHHFRTSVSRRLNRKRCDYISESLIKKYSKTIIPKENIATSFKSNHDTDFGDQTGFKKGKVDYLKEYHQMISSGYILELNHSMLLDFLSWESTGSKSAIGLYALTSDDSSIEFEKHDPSLSEQQPNLPSSYPLAQ